MIIASVNIYQSIFSHSITISFCKVFFQSFNYCFIFQSTTYIISGIQLFIKLNVCCWPFSARGSLSSIQSTILLPLHTRVNVPTNVQKTYIYFIHPQNIHLLYPTTPHIFTPTPPQNTFTLLQARIKIKKKRRRKRLCLPYYFMGWC